MTAYSQSQIMLSLSLLSYRGFWNPGRENHASMARAIVAGLEKLEPLAGDWRLVWGPGTYRYLGSVFDSSMMYVVQHTRERGRHAIVVRGTNPLALLDWLLGDFLHHRQVPWYQWNSGAETEAALSLSSALGLNILLDMRDEQLAGSLGAVRGGATPERDTAAVGIRDRLVRQLQRYQQHWSFAGQVAGGLMSTLGNLRRLDHLEQRLTAREQLTQVLDESFDAVGGEEPGAILMQSGVERGEDVTGGAGLLDFLRTRADRFGDSLDVCVTGHSKGGALAPVLALFLSDTQSALTGLVPPHYRWNLGSPASISCYAFAGPTPGNSAFSRYFQQRLGRFFYRYANTLDPVTYAWQSEGIQKINALYGEASPPPEGLQRLLRQMGSEVAHLDYCQLGEDVREPGFIRDQSERHVIEFTPSLGSEKRPFALQAAYQHIGGYLDVLGLDRFFTVPEVMGLH